MMPAVAISTVNGFTKEIEWYENQRFWVGKGWSSTLLPNDHGKFTVEDGSMRWSTSEAAALALLEPGWKYLSTNIVSSDWMYARDFTASAKEMAVVNERGLLHLVRFRKLSQTAELEASKFSRREGVPLCEHCDSKAVYSLSEHLLEVSAYRCRSPDISQKNRQKLHNELLRWLLDYESTDKTEEDALYQMDLLYQAVHDFVEKERTRGGFLKTLFSSSKISFKDRYDIEDYTKLCDSMSWAEAERIAITRLLIQRLDRDSQLHCGKCKGDSVCHFRWVSCPNAGCTESHSRIYMPEHDDVCKYKVIVCQCGENFTRSTEAEHLATGCPYRQTECPFQHVGCKVSVIAKDMPSHVTTEAPSHLMLVLQRMREYEDTIRKLNSRQQAQDRELLELKRLLALQKENETKQASIQERKLTALQKKVNAMETKTRKEIKRLDERE